MNRFLGLALALLLPTATSAQVSFSEQDVIWLTGTPDTADFAGTPKITRLASGGYVASGLTVPYLLAKYDSTGAFVDYIGGYGQGPGEFTDVRGLTTLEEKLAVISYGRVTLLTAEGEYLDATPVRSGSVTTHLPGRISLETSGGPSELRLSDGPFGLDVEELRYQGEVPTALGFFINGSLICFELDGAARDHQGNDLGWDLFEGIPYEETADRPAETRIWSLQGVASRGSAVFIAAVAQEGSQGLWLRSPGGHVTRIGLPEGSFAFVSGPVIGVLRRDEFGLVRVGILPL